MKYYIIAGEASGDLHGSNLIKAIKSLDSKADFRVWGGDLMENAGGHLVKHYKDLAFMGFIEVLKNIRTILKNMDFCKKDIAEYQPDAVIMIDYPGFNLRIAKWTRQQGYKNLYYISPQLWAWKPNRVYGIKENIDKLFVILPFEKAFYDKYDYPVDFVGHPLLDVVKNYPKPVDFRSRNGLNEKPIIALLPGSRKQEITRMLKVMLAASKEYSEKYQVVIAGAPSIPLSFYEGIIQDYKQDIKIVSNQTYPLLSEAKAALVTSGTATLETALFKVPQVVCYRGNQLSFMIAKKLVSDRIKFIALANLIVDEAIVTELIQNELTTENLSKELNLLLHDESKKAQIQQGYEQLHQILGNEGASTRTANLVVEYLS
ncbi:MAG: lipid-A-disaccharide synthase [Bacteroidota bacterium]